MPANRNDAMTSAQNARGGDAAPDPQRLAVRQRTARLAGIPEQWLTDDGRVSVTERIAGADYKAGRLYTTASSTGGGATDMHTLDFPVGATGEVGEFNMNKHLMGDLDSEGVGTKKWTFTGRLENVPDAKPDAEGWYPKRVKWEGMNPAED